MGLPAGCHSAPFCGERIDSAREPIHIGGSRIEGTGDLAPFRL
jgi:hypothetical protein